jgi:glutamate dehydrogenase/leucine dehydrogenase
VSALRMPGTTNTGGELLAGAIHQLDRAAKVIGLDPGMHRLLRTNERSLIVSVPVVMDDGRLEVFTGYRVQHSTGRGPGKGGIRFHPSVTLQTKAKVYDASYREAAFIVAVERVARAVEQPGIFPSRRE